MQITLSNTLWLDNLITWAVNLPKNSFCISKLGFISDLMIIENRWGKISTSHIISDVAPLHKQIIKAGMLGTQMQEDAGRKTHDHKTNSKIIKK